MRTQILGWWHVVVLIAFAMVGLYGMTINYHTQRERDIDALTRDVYWEALAAGEPELSARVAAHVVVVRADANRSYWGRSDIHDVVYARATKPNGKVVCQFSWTCDDTKRNAKPGHSALWQLARRIATEELDETFSVPAKFAQAVGYNYAKYSASKNVCSAKLALISLGKVEEGSKHEFYREPEDLNDYAARPVRHEVPECRPKDALAHHHKPLGHLAEGSFLPLPYIYCVLEEGTCGKSLAVIECAHADQAEEEQGHQRNGHP